MYKLDKKGLGYYKDKKPKVSSTSGFNRSTWTPGDDKKKKKKKKKKTDIKVIAAVEKCVGILINYSCIIATIRLYSSITK